MADTEVKTGVRGDDGDNDVRRRLLLDLRNLVEQRLQEEPEMGPAILLGAIIRRAGGEIRIKESELVRIEGTVEISIDQKTREIVYRLRE